MIAFEATSMGLAPELVEDVNRRTANSALYRNPNNSKVNTSYISSNIFYEERSGEWEKQDLNFRLSRADHVSNRGAYHARVLQEGIALNDPKTGVGIRWNLPVRPTIAGRYASFSADGVEWVYEKGPKRTKLSGTVRTPLGLKIYTFPYTLLGNASDFRIEDGHAVADGIRVAAPYIIGANELRYPTTGWIITPGGLTFSFNDRILPASAYPYVIDPTTTLQPSSGLDARIASNDPTWQGQDQFVVGDNSEGANNAARSFLEFDITSIPSGDSIDDVIVSLWEFGANGTGSWNVELRVVLQSIVHSQVTHNIYSTGNNWASAGCSTDGTDRRAAISKAVSFDGTSAGAFVDFDGATVDQDFQDWLDGTTVNNGYLVFAPTAENQGAARKDNSLRSSEATTASERPKAVIVHTFYSISKAVLSYHYQHHLRSMT